MMKEVAENLRKVVAEALPLLQDISDVEASLKILPHKWSNKEVLGHLIDSACNNQQKFVRTMAEAELEFVGYQQNFWVASQKYNTANWQILINLWHAYNLHLAHIIENVEAETLSHSITISDAGNFTLKFIMEDYVEHLKHHLNQILPTLNLNNNFQNIYNT